MAKQNMTFYCKVCKNPYKHRGGSQYYCKTCKTVHTIEKWRGTDGKEVYIEDPKPMPAPTEEQKRSFVKYMKEQGVDILKRPSE